MRTIVVFLLILSVAGCASTYKPEGFGGGFSETQLDTNVFMVSFRGNGFTRPEIAEELALLRCADLALKNGFTHFVIIDSRSRETLSTSTTPTQSYTTAGAASLGNFATDTANTTTYGGQTITTSKPSTTNTIMCFKGKPDITALVYDAQFIFNSLAQKYGVAGAVK